MFKKIKEFFDSDKGFTFLTFFIMFIIAVIMCCGIYFSEPSHNTTTYAKSKTSFGYRMNLHGKMGWGIGTNGINYYNFGKTH